MASVVMSSLCPVLCLTFYLTALVSGSHIVLTSSPVNVRPLVTEHLTLRCGLKDGAATAVIGRRDVKAASDVSVVQSIVISKAGVDLASVSERQPAQAYSNRTGVAVTGQTDVSGAERAYLQLSWQYPDSGQSGTYQCLITGMDHSGKVLTLISTCDVTETAASFADVVSYVNQLLLNNQLQKTEMQVMKATIHDLDTNNNALKTEMKTMNVTIHDLNSTNNALKTEMTKINANIRDMKTSNADQNAQMNNLITANVDLNTSLAVLRTRQDTHVMFTAVLYNDVSLEDLETVVFDHLWTSVGGGFNTSSGVFTCPVAGYYTFYVHITSQTDKFSDVYIYHNDNNWLASLVCEDNMGRQSASTSANVLLDKGETVSVVNSHHSDIAGSWYARTSFSGHLVALK